MYGRLSKGGVQAAAGRTAIVPLVRLDDLDRVVAPGSHPGRLGEGSRPPRSPDVWFDRTLGIDLSWGKLRLASESRRPIPADHGATPALRRPMISVDTKKKELVGAFKNAGASGTPRLSLRSRGPRHPLRDLRSAGQYRHGLRRRDRRHPGMASKSGGAPRVAFPRPKLSRSSPSGGSNGSPRAPGNSTCNIASATAIARVTVAQYPTAASRASNTGQQKLGRPPSRQFETQPAHHSHRGRVAVRAHLGRKSTRPASKSAQCDSFASQATPPCPDGTTPSNPRRKPELIFADP